MKLRITLLLLMAVQVAGAQPARSAKPVVHQTPIALPPPGLKDWFVAKWESKVTSEEYSKGDFNGITATLRHQGNVYKVQCMFLSILYKDKGEPGGLEISDSMKKGPKPCTVLSSYVGKTIPSDNRIMGSDGWIISLPSDNDSGSLTFDKSEPVGGVPVGGAIRQYSEWYSIVSVEVIEDKEAKH